MRPGVISRLMIRMLFTPLRTPQAAWAPRILEGVGVLVDSAEALVEVRDDLLYPDDESSTQ